MVGSPQHGALIPQTYKVRLEGSVAKDIENTMSASSDLVTLRKSAPVSPVGLILRARGDTVRLKTVLNSYGYYQSAVTATIDGEPLISADLADNSRRCRPRRRLRWWCRSRRARCTTWARSASPGICPRPSVPY
ncbi:MAG: hypothetical protein WDM77_22095 [Steroidobacteraceae bacterium]